MQSAPTFWLRHQRSAATEIFQFHSEKNVVQQVTEETEEKAACESAWIPSLMIRWLCWVWESGAADRLSQRTASKTPAAQQVTIRSKRETDKGNRSRKKKDQASTGTFIAIARMQEKQKAPKIKAVLSHRKWTGRTQIISFHLILSSACDY